jgi:hypothetical protein
MAKRSVTTTSVSHKISNQFGGEAKLFDQAILAIYISVVVFVRHALLTSNLAVGFRELLAIVLVAINLYPIYKFTALRVTGFEPSANLWMSRKEIFVRFLVTSLTVLLLVDFG